jgi:hypothetical protein
MEEGQATQWPKEKGQKDKQRSTNITHKTTDRVTRPHLKPGVNSCAIFFIALSVLSNVYLLMLVVSFLFTVNWNLIACILHLSIIIYTDWSRDLIWTPVSPQTHINRYHRKINHICGVMVTVLHSCLQCSRSWDGIMVKDIVSTSAKCSLNYIYKLNKI